MRVNSLVQYRAMALGHIFSKLIDMYIIYQKIKVLIRFSIDIRLDF